MANINYTGIDWNNYNQSVQPYSLLTNHTKEELKAGIIFESHSKGYRYRLVVAETSVRVEIINRTDPYLSFSRAYCVFSVGEKFYTLKTGVQGYNGEEHHINRRALRSMQGSIEEISARTLEHGYFNLQAVQYIVNPILKVINEANSLGILQL